MRWVVRERRRGEVDLPILFGALLVAGGLAAAAWFRLGGGGPPCLFKAVTSVPCPTCGSTRLARALTEFRPMEAFLWNPLLFLVLSGTLLAAMVSGYRRMRGLPRIRPELESSLERTTVRILAVLGLAAGWFYLWIRGV